MTYRLDSRVIHQLAAVGHNSKGNLFLNEQSGNVIENKGPLWKTCGEA
jgi:hypothetical protein